MILGTCSLVTLQLISLIYKIDNRIETICLTREKFRYIFAA